VAFIQACGRFLPSLNELNESKTTAIRKAMTWSASAIYDHGFTLSVDVRGQPVAVDALTPLREN